MGMFPLDSAPLVNQTSCISSSEKDYLFYPHNVYLVGAINFPWKDQALLYIRHYRQLLNFNISKGTITVTLPIFYICRQVL